MADSVTFTKKIINEKLRFSCSDNKTIYKYPEEFFKKVVIKNLAKFRSSLSQVFLGKVVLKMCNKFAGEHPGRSVISIMLLCNFIEIAFRHGCSPVNLLHIFRTPFSKNTSGGLPLKVHDKTFVPVSFLVTLHAVGLQFNFIKMRLRQTSVFF